MVFEDVCIFVHLAYVTSALEGLRTQLFGVLFAWLCCISSVFSGTRVNTVYLRLMKVLQRRPQIFYGCIF